MTTKEKIKAYVDDHFNCFGFFPCDVDVDEEENNSEEAE